MELILRRSDGVEFRSGQRTFEVRDIRKSYDETFSVTKNENDLTISFSKEISFLIYPEWRAPNLSESYIYFFDPNSSFSFSLRLGVNKKSEREWIHLFREIYLSFGISCFENIRTDFSFVDKANVDLIFFLSKLSYFTTHPPSYEDGRGVNIFLDKGGKIIIKYAFWLVKISLIREEEIIFENKKLHPEKVIALLESEEKKVVKDLTGKYQTFIGKILLSNKK